VKSGGNKNQTSILIFKQSKLFAKSKSFVLDPNFQLMILINTKKIDPFSEVYKTQNDEKIIFKKLKTSFVY